MENEELKTKFCTEGVKPLEDREDNSGSYNPNRDNSEEINKPNKRYGY